MLLSHATDILDIQHLRTDHMDPGWQHFNRFIACRHIFSTGSALVLENRLTGDVDEREFNRSTSDP
jgi:hypothetical protein